MSSGIRIVLLGRQGAGKGTQCLRLSRHYVVPHISTGDMLRAAVREDSALGRSVEKIIGGGGLVSDELIIEVVRDRLNKADTQQRGYILDGFPRTVVQAEALDVIAEERPLLGAVDLVVPRDLVLSRLSARRVCRDCGANYTVSGVARSPWSCDTCGGDVVLREDDTPDAINRRLDLYESQTAPLISFYGGTHRLHEVDGVGSQDEVFDRITAVIDQAGGGS
ncbi:MAG: adenylate kinase [Actinomycetes bacterium]|jgi:adenylate kinase